jgi:hypothetical protein
MKFNRSSDYMKGIIFSIFALLFVCKQADARLLGPNTYEECLDEVIKNSKVESAINLGATNCKLKFPRNEALIKDCAATWIGGKFLKGTPSNVSNYRRIGVSDTTHEIYFPINMSKDTIETTMRNNYEQIEKICLVR